MYDRSMFSGIIESVQPIISSDELQQAFRIQIRRPADFNDIKPGDSIAVDGVCLTVEVADQSSISFVLAAETIRVLKWLPENWIGRQVNLERSLRVGDRLHGHFVSGHVDSLGKVVRAEKKGDSFFLDVEITEELVPLVWQKGSIALNGVSLTINAIDKNIISVCLIPETVQRTNLGALKKGDNINVEPDVMARAMMRAIQTGLRSMNELS